MKQPLTGKDQQGRRKQREMHLLYGKLAAASPLADADHQRVLADALQRLVIQGQQVDTRAGEQSGAG